MDLITITAYGTAFSAIFIFFSACIMLWQSFITRRASNASAFKAVYDMLQDEKIRKARGFVFDELDPDKLKFIDWKNKKEDKEKAEEVCYSYNSVGTICRNKYFPVEEIAKIWNDSLIKSWNILKPLVEEYRNTRGKNYWEDFEWLAKQAKEIKQNGNKKEYLKSKIYCWFNKDIWSLDC
ncbi:hypothetical protein KKB18_13135 [bacterium]|nr:hypothetical protein [bacterium]